MFDKLEVVNDPYRTLVSIRSAEVETEGATPAIAAGPHPYEYQLYLDA